MRSSKVAALGLAAAIGCGSHALPERFFYQSVTGTAVGDEIVVALTRVSPGEPYEIDVARVRLGSPVTLVPALVGRDASQYLGAPQLAAIDGKAYLTYFADSTYHGAPLGADDTVDTAATIDLGYNPALVPVGDRFAAVSFPQQGLIAIFVSGTFHATFIAPDGQRNGELDLATQARPLGTIGLIPRCAGNAGVLAMPLARSQLSGGFDRSIARASGGALLAPEIDLGIDVGDVEVAVTADGATLAIYDRVTATTQAVHVLRIEPGASPATSDQLADLAAVPTMLVPGAAGILAVTPPPITEGLPRYDSFETRILDDHGRTIAGPFTVATGDSDASIFATSSGFAVLHGLDDAATRLTLLGSDGSPGETIAIASPPP